MINRESWRNLSHILGIILAILLMFCLVKTIVDETKCGSSYVSIEKYSFIGTGQIYKATNPGSFSHDDKLVRVFNLKKDFDKNDTTYLIENGNFYVILNGHFDREIPVNTDILFRLDNMALRMYVNGSLFYEYGNLHQRPRFALLPGSVWESVNSGSSGISENDEITIELSNYSSYKAYRSLNLFLSSIYPAESDFLLTPAINKSLLCIVFSIMIVILGVIIIFMYFVLRYAKMKLPELFALGLFFISTGLWFVIEYDIITFFIPFNSFLRILEIVCMVLMSTFFICYCCYFLKTVWRSILLVFVNIDFLLLIVALVLQFTGVFDVHEKGQILVFLVAYKTIFVIIAFIYETVKGVNEDSRKLLLSFVPPAIVAVISSLLYSYISFNGVLLVFFILFSLIQLKIIVDSLQKLVNKNAEVKYLKEMAYRDVLTHVGNRNGYQNKIEKLEAMIHADEKKTLLFKGLAVFDINNLKHTNDLYGHQNGDILIKNAAHIICIVFAHSPVFRMGGDEFVALLSPTDCLRIDSLKQSFFNAVEHFNYTNPNEIPVSVAIGFAVSQSETEISFDEVFSRADKDMYNVKIDMKREAALIVE